MEPDEARELARRVRRPVLVIHGELDRCQPRERAVAVAELTGGTLVALEGAGRSRARCMRWPGVRLPRRPRPRYLKLNRAV
jgi:hypothetical protein